MKKYPYTRLRQEMELIVLKMKHAEESEIGLPGPLRVLLQNLARDIDRLTERKGR